jgi:pimeloyl-ACP methyl ester carboxylesterase
MVSVNYAVTAREQQQRRAHAMLPKYMIAAGVWLALTACSPVEQNSETSMPEQTSDETMAEAPVAAASGLGTVDSPDGVTIHYADQGAGPASIVFVHGWNCDRSYWDAQRDYFASSYRVITVDLAGHGASGDNRENFTIESFGADVAAVVRALDLSNVVLVGHSMGGPVVLEAGNLLKGRVAAVVGVDTLRSVASRPTAADIDARIARLDVDFVGDVKAIVRTMFVAESDPATRDWVVEDMAAAPPRVSKSAMRGLSSYDSGRALTGLDVPFVLINSSYRPTDQASISALANSFQYIEMPGVGHFVMMDDPTTFNAHLAGVIESLLL